MPERILTRERQTYLDERIAARFARHFDDMFDGDSIDMDGILKLLEEQRQVLARKHPDEYPEGASREDVLVNLLNRIAGRTIMSTDQVVEFALLWGERFGAGEYDADRRYRNMIQNTRFREQLDRAGEILQQIQSE